jgi:hypothetical protein
LSFDRKIVIDAYLEEISKFKELWRWDYLKKYLVEKKKYQLLD